MEMRVHEWGRRVGLAGQGPQVGGGGAAADEARAATWGYGHGNEGMRIGSWEGGTGREPKVGMGGEVGGGWGLAAKGSRRWEAAGGSGWRLGAWGC
ncbi:hypothetical protein COCNU_scaffold033914G000020 [Cocos nucifera]|nr:hypothetical protein [Cocos nucifera]